MCIINSFYSETEPQINCDFCNFVTSQEISHCSELCPPGPVIHPSPLFHHWKCSHPVAAKLRASLLLIG